MRQRITLSTGRVIDILLRLHCNEPPVTQEHGPRITGSRNIDSTNERIVGTQGGGNTLFEERQV